MNRMSGLAALAVVVVLACKPIAGPEVNPPSFAKGGSEGRVVESVTGSGHLTRPAAPPFDQFRTFSLTARRQANATVKGSFQLNNHGSIIDVKGIVSCFTIIGNQAWLGGTFEKVTNPAFVGFEAAFRVVDNGEGRNAPPDQISFIPFDVPGSGLAQSECDETPDFPALFDIEDGNIQIH